MQGRIFPREESGLTLVELLVALALLGLLGAAVFNLYHSGVRAWQKSIGRMDSQQNARAAVEMIDRELRFANWVEVPEEKEIRYRLKGDFGPDSPRCYRCFSLSGEQLVMKELRDSGTYSYNVVALGLREVKFSLDRLNNVHLTVTAGTAGETVTLRSSILPRNLPRAGAP